MIFQPSEDVQSVLRELEELEDGFSVESQPEWSTKAATQGPKTVKLWQVPRTTGQLLAQLITEHQPQAILELGTSAGYSAIWMGAAAAEYGGSVTTIDSSSLKVEMAQQYIDRAGLSETIDVIHAPIADALQQWSTPVDFVFMDADKKNYLRFFQMIEPFLNAGALIVADDAVKIRHAMEDFITLLSESSEYEVQEIDMDHGLLIARRT